MLSPVKHWCILSLTRTGRFLAKCELEHRHQGELSGTMGIKLLEGVL
jgi:hypothetical protein